MRNANIVKSERGQILVFFALILPLLVLFAGLAIDAGLLYVTKARLSAAADGACLTGMKNLAQGNATATTLATDIFNANYGANPPTPTVTFPTDQYGDLQVQVTATANVNTIFMRYLPKWATVPVSDTAVATRGKLVMSIVVDRSGSMCGPPPACESGLSSGDGGGAALQSAVPNFVDLFDNSIDEVALISFSDNTIINSPIGTSFQSPITSAIGTMQFVGGTFGTGASPGTTLSPATGQTSGSTAIGPPMSVADWQNNNNGILTNGVPITTGQNVIKVLVYMTDGLMNTIQDNFYCGGKCTGSGCGTTNLTLINYGGYDSGTTVAFFDPTCTSNLQLTGCTNESGHKPIWGTCDDGCPDGFPYNSSGAICENTSGGVVTTFYSQQTGEQTDFSRANVTAETQYRAIQTASAMRTETPIPTYIYTIGLGSSVSPTTQAFLAQLANDPSYSTYISGQPAGLFQYVADCPSSTCTTSLNTVFQTIAAKVLLRLTE